MYLNYISHPISLCVDILIMLSELWVHKLLIMPWQPYHACTLHTIISYTSNSTQEIQYDEEINSGSSILCRLYIVSMWMTCTGVSGPPWGILCTTAAAALTSAVLLQFLLNVMCIGVVGQYCALGTVCSCAVASMSCQGHIHAIYLLYPRSYMYVEVILIVFIDSDQ